MRESKVKEYLDINTTGENYPFVFLSHVLE